MRTKNRMIRSALLGAGFIVGTGGAQAQLTNGLLSYWNFEDDVVDQAGALAGTSGTSDDNGTLNGNVGFAVSQSAGFGQAASFDGVAGSFISIADPSEGTNDIDRTGADMSVSVWIQANSWDTAWQTILAHGEGTDYRLSRMNAVSPIPFSGVAGTGDIVSDTTFGEAPEGDELWHHIVLTAANGGVSVLYVDGVEEATSADLDNPTVAIAENTTGMLDQFYIGANPDVDNREFNGLIDDVAIWDRALTATEVNAIFNQGVAGQDLSSLLNSDDSDLDGLPDAWEIVFGFDTNDNTGDNGATGDPDGDTISNLDEFQNGTSPILADTDGDGLNDNEEPNSDPTLADTDGDGLNDLEEFNAGSDPNLVDTDSDTLPDVFEVNNQLDPTVDDTTLDPDGDNLSNLQEFTAGTDPQDNDTDDDFSLDGDEFQNETDPLNPDSDGDNLLDGNETGTGAFNSETDTGTDPNNADSDGDGFNDDVEISVGSNPNDIDSAPASATLPIFDDFEDDSINFGIWNTITGTVPQNRAGTILGGSVTEEGGSIVIDSRGYLHTNTEFDPEVVGGLEITGELTFLNPVDVVSVLTRSDVTPITAFGEANSGVQFVFSPRGNNIDILARNGDHTVENLVIDGTIEFQVNVPYSFTVIDDGAGGLSMVITDIETPENTISATAELTGDTSDSNFVAIYNREDGRDSSFEQLAISSLLGPTSIDIQSITFDPVADQFTLTWTSAVGIDYVVFGSPDLIDFSVPVTQSIPGQAGTTSATFPNPNPSVDRFFFRVGLPVE